MQIGYIINGEHPLLKTITVSEIKSIIDSPSISAGVIPIYKKILIVGMDESIAYDPTIPLYDITFTEQAGYCFSPEEGKENYELMLKGFITHCVEEYIKDYSFIFVSDITEIKWSEHIFKLETSIGLYIVNSSKEIYYMNKQFMQYFEKPLILEIPKHITVWQWDDSLSALLKSSTTEEFVESIQLQNILAPYCDVNKYYAAFCMEIVQHAGDYEGISFDTWNRAYRVENYLSTLKVRVDVTLLEELSEDNAICQAVLDKVEDGYVIQHYKGTDKTTGRIFPSGDGYSLQTFPKELRTLVIADEDCLLVEFDYQYFEYSLLAQIIGLDLKGDPHKELAKMLFNDETMRPIAKIINYGLLYGRSLNTMATELINEHKVAYSKEELIDTLKLISIPFEKLNEKLQKEFDENGFILNVFGRKVIPSKRFACVNNYIQATASDYIIAKIEKTKFYLEGKNGLNKIVLQNHDSILINLSIKDIENTNIASDILNILESEENGLNTKVDIKHGNNWAFS